jgi:hypothetical protein
MSRTERSRPLFLGTYFDRSLVLRVARAAVGLGWLILAVYILEYGYNAYLNISGALLNGYPIDVAFLLLNLKGPLLGVMAVVLLYSVAQILLILLDIEDNTREARHPSRPAGDPR